MKCGIDLIHPSRIENLVTRRGGAYLSKIWTAQEIKDCTRSDGTFRFDSLAARFAAKEAVSKAFGTGFGRDGVRLDEIEILENAAGAPYVVLHGTTRAFYERNGYRQLEISLSHDLDTSIAMCILQESGHQEPERAESPDNEGKH